MLNVNFTDPHIVGMRGTASWREAYFDFLDDFINSVGNDSAMIELEDITGAVFDNKSKLLGRLVAGLIETKYGHLLDQEYLHSVRGKLIHYNPYANYNCFRFHLYRFL